MKITELQHDCDAFFLAGDFISTHNYVVINDRKEIFRNGEPLVLREPMIWENPRVQILSDTRFLMVEPDDDNPSPSVPNAFILTETGEVEKAFCLGDVHQMIATETSLVISSSECTDSNRLAVFDFDGKRLYEYDQQAAESNKVNFWEIMPS